MARHREQDACINCGATAAYALDLCEPCYRFERRTGRARKPIDPETSQERRFARREHRIVRELEAANLRILVLWAS